MPAYVYLESGFVRFAPMSHVENDHQMLVIIDGVNDAPVAHAKPPPGRCSFEFPDTGRAGSRPESLDPGDDASRHADRQSIYLFNRRSLDDDAVFGQTTLAPAARQSSLHNVKRYGLFVSP